MPMVNLVKEWLKEGRNVKIFTARGTMSPQDAVRAYPAIEAWCLKHIGRVLPITAHKDVNMVALWDDRAVKVIPNVGVMGHNLYELGEFVFSRTQRFRKANGVFPPSTKGVIDAQLDVLVHCILPKLKHLNNVCDAQEFSKNIASCILVLLGISSEAGCLDIESDLCAVLSKYTIRVSEVENGR
jgi:predicted mannosyl-3-phosphoglycerate phosphatase (HAD superfamily)